MVFKLIKEQQEAIKDLNNKINKLENDFYYDKRMNLLKEYENKYNVSIEFQSNKYVVYSLDREFISNIYFRGSQLESYEALVNGEKNIKAGIFDLERKRNVKMEE